MVMVKVNPFRPIVKILWIPVVINKGIKNITPNIKINPFVLSQNYYALNFIILRCDKAKRALYDLILAPLSSKANTN